jgi:hypothetical protein
VRNGRTIEPIFPASTDSNPAGTVDSLVTAEGVGRVDEYELGFEEAD